MSKNITSLGNKSILHSDFKYTSSAKTDIRKTFARIKRQLSGGQDKNKPLVSDGGNSLLKPLVLNPGGFVLPSEWMGEKD
jgi:hypothetical protein